MSQSIMPYEIVSEVVSYLDSPLSSYSTVSRVFQTVVEARTFRHLKIHDAEGLAELPVVVGQKRYHLVRHIDFGVYLPEYGPHLSDQAEDTSIIISRISRKSGPSAAT